MPETMTFPQTHQGVRNLDAIRGDVLPISGGPAPAPRVNVHSAERAASAVAGGMLALWGLREGSLLGILFAVAGGSLLYRGLTGHCSLYQALGMSTAGRPAPGAEVVYRPTGERMRQRQQGSLAR